MTTIGIFGGTFDPIHFGHLRTAFELLQALKLNEIRFMPAGNPPHREVTVASPAERFAMVEAAIAGQPGFVVDDREIRREGLSYSVDTMRTLRADFPDHALSLIVGMDAFLGLPKWHQWRELLELAHLVVAHRPHRRPARAACRLHLHSRGDAAGDFFDGSAQADRGRARPALPDAGRRARDHRANRMLSIQEVSMV